MVLKPLLPYQGLLIHGRILINQLLEKLAELHAVTFCEQPSGQCQLVGGTRVLLQLDSAAAGTAATVWLALASKGSIDQEILLQCGGDELHDSMNLAPSVCLPKQ